MRGLLGVAAALMVVMPDVALAQSPRPMAELGVQVSEKTGGTGSFGQVLRLTVPLKRRAAIEITASGQSSSDTLTSPDIQATTISSTSEMEVSVHWRQTVFASGRLQIFGVLGGGKNRVKTSFFRSVPGRVEADDRSQVSEFVAHLGPALQVELARWLGLRFDLQGIIGQRNSGVRGMMGAVIQIPRFRLGDPPGAPAPATPSATPNIPGSTLPPTGWQRVKPGRSVWVTTDTGSVVHGEIAAISDSSLIIREQDREVTIQLADVRLVEGRDSLKNGFLIGAVPGAVAGGLIGAGLAEGCEYECGDTISGIMSFGVGGAAVGGLLGLMVDRLIPGRQTLFGGSTTVVTPVITPTKKAIDVAIRWR